MPQQIEPPYEVILDRLRQGKVVPFVGAGASIVGRPEGTAWRSESEFPPRGAELSSLLARKSNFIGAGFPKRAPIGDGHNAQRRRSSAVVT